MAALREARDASCRLLKAEEKLFYPESVAIVFVVRKELNSDAVAKPVDMSKQFLTLTSQAGNVCRRLMRTILLAFFLLSLPVGCSLTNHLFGGNQSKAWWELRRDSSHQAPDPAENREAVIQAVSYTHLTLPTKA